MFSLNHFIWLFIVAVLIGTMIIVNKKYKLSFNANLNILLGVMIISEVVKILSNMDLEVTTKSGITGVYLDPGSLPFHLCSMQIFFAFALKFFVKSEKTKNILLCFMAPTMLVGATMSLLIPTVGVEFTVPQVYQYFLFHGYIIYFAIYLLTDKIIILDFKAYLHTMSLLLVCVVIALGINSVLNIYAVNFFYLSRPPMENLPILNLDHGWPVYFASLVFIAILLMTLFHLPFMIKNRKRKCENNLHN